MRSQTAVGRRQLSCSAKTMQMPIFPLSVVALPGVQVSLRFVHAHSIYLSSVTAGLNVYGRHVEAGERSARKPGHFVGTGACQDPS